MLFRSVAGAAARAGGVRRAASDRAATATDVAALLAFDPMINIREISIKCGHCDTYQTLMSFARRGDWNVYTYECENDQCDPAVTRTLVEVPRQLDTFARRDPEWGTPGPKSEPGPEGASGQG